jgi:ABC-type multidrug transport system fused ATPase/permease subunit
MVVGPARASRILEPTTTIDPAPQPRRGDDSPRPRRALFAEPLSLDADEEKSTATEAGIGRRAMEPLPQAVRAPLQPPPAPLPPPPITVPPVPSATPIPTLTSPARRELPVETAYAPPPPAPRPQPRPAARAAELPERPKPRMSHQPTPRQTAPVAGRRAHATRSRLRHEVPPIIVDRLIKSYNGRLAVRDLSFVVQPGRVTGFLGPNGAGKTTTMRILVGLTTPTTGTATFGGLEYAELPHPQRTVGCVLDASFHPARSGRNHLRVLAPTAGASDRRVDKLLDAVGLGDVARQPVGEYSTGMRQRLALAAWTRKASDGSASSCGISRLAAGRS